MFNSAGWLRQARHRAKKHGVLSDLTTEDIKTIFEEHKSSCAYCGDQAGFLDNPVPFSEGGQSVPANVVPCCHRCKTIKRNHSVVWMHDKGHMDPAVFVGLVHRLTARRGGSELKSILRRLVGIDAAEK